MTLEESMLKLLHLGSFKNKELLNNNYHKLCGCFYCRKTFSPDEINEWVDTDGTSALCPKCGVDSVIPVRYEVDVDAVLLAMSKYWFRVSHD